MANPIENFNLVEGINLNDSNFTPEEISEAQSIIRQYISDRYIDLDFSELSSLNDVVVRPMAQLFLIFKYLITSFSKTNTLLSALESDQSSAKIVDALLSNFSIFRRPGNIATGKVKLVVAGSQNSFLIPGILEFQTIDGIKFKPTKSFVATQNPTSAEELNIIYENDKKQSTVIIPVIAVESGSKYNIEQYTPLSIQSGVFDFISASAFNKFSGGANAESNKEIIERLVPALSARNLASPLAIEQTLRENFPFIQQLAIHGVNSPNMTRNSHNIFGIKSGCFCDVYVKTSQFFEESVIESVAEKIVWADPQIPILANHIGKYVIKINRDDSPGYYSVDRITSNENNVLGSYLILDSFKKINNLYGDGIQKNYINGVIEGNYSSYVEEYVVFDPIEDPNPTGTSLAVKVYFRGIPSIKEIQEFVNGSNAQTALVDTLVRACIPCVVQLSELKIRIKAGTISAEDIQTLVVDYINGLDPKIEQIRVDGIISSLKQNSAIISIDTPILVKAQIFAPDEAKSVVEVYSESNLTIPERLDIGFNKNNVGFFCRKSDIPVSVIEV